MRFSQRQTIAELQKLRFGSVEFYDLACRYFCRRLRVIRNCGLFFIFMAVVCVIIAFTQRGSWSFEIKFCLFALFFAAIGWVPYRIGKTGIEMIKTARLAGTQHQMKALHFIAATAKPFRGDPVGGFVLQQFGHKKHAA
jgi:hypothetical protein